MRRWTGDLLSALEASYKDDTHTLKQVAKRHTTTIGNVARLAKKHNWSRRRPSGKDPRVSMMKQRRDYVQKRIREFTRELDQLNAKLKFIETLSA